MRGFIIALLAAAPVVAKGALRTTTTSPTGYTGLQTQMFELPITSNFSYATYDFEVSLSANTPACRQQAWAELGGYVNDPRSVKPQAQGTCLNGAVPFVNCADYARVGLKFAINVDPVLYPTFDFSGTANIQGVLDALAPSFSTTNYTVTMVPYPLEAQNVLMVRAYASSTQFLDDWSTKTSQTIAYAGDASGLPAFQGEATLENGAFMAGSFFSPIGFGQDPVPASGANCSSQDNAVHSE